MNTVPKKKKKTKFDASPLKHENSSPPTPMPMPDYYSLRIDHDYNVKALAVVAGVVQKHFTIQKNMFKLLQNSFFTESMFVLKLCRNGTMQSSSWRKHDQATGLAF